MALVGAASDPTDPLRAPCVPHVVLHAVCHNRQLGLHHTLLGLAHAVAGVCVHRAPQRRVRPQHPQQLPLAACVSTPGLNAALLGPQGTGGRCASSGWDGTYYVGHSFNCRFHMWQELMYHAASDVLGCGAVCVRTAMTVQLAGMCWRASQHVDVDPLTVVCCDHAAVMLCG